MQLILYLIIIKNKKITSFENFKLDSTTKASLFKLLKNVEVTREAGIDKFQEKF